MCCDIFLKGSFYSNVKFVVADISRSSKKFCLGRSTFMMLRYYLTVRNLYCSENPVGLVEWQIFQKGLIYEDFSFYKFTMAMLFLSLVGQTSNEQITTNIWFNYINLSRSTYRTSGYGNICNSLRSPCLWQLGSLNEINKTNRTLPIPS